MGECLHREFIANLPTGVLVVDTDIRLVEANRYALESMGVGPGIVMGRRFGEVFACSSLRLEGDECGSTEDCRSCGLRSEVSSVLSGNRESRDFMFSHGFLRNGTTEVKWFKVSIARMTAGTGEAYALVALNDFSSEKEHEERLFRAATMDMPTGAYNKYYSLDRLGTFLSQGSGFCLAMVDFDHFKYFNDTYGHQMGDRLLAGFVAMSKGILRATDLCGRYGGEEFIILLPRTDIEDAVAVLQRLMEGLARLGRELVGQEVTLSAGLVCVGANRGDHADPDMYVRMADELLYKAKGNGRNRIEY